LRGFAIASCLFVGALGVGGDEAFLIVTFAGASFFAVFFTTAAFFTGFALATGLRDFEATFDFDELFFAALAAFLFDFAMILYLPRGFEKELAKIQGQTLNKKCKWINIP
jgi:hypothetical protein